MVVLIATLIQPAAALTPLAQTDVAAFSSRAEEWANARDSHRDDARELALEIVGSAREDLARGAEEERLAQVEADRLAERERQAEIASATTTTRPATTTTRPPTTTSAPTSTAAPAAAATSGEPTAAQWKALRQCESSGNYGAVSPNGRHRGAYQFSQDTWDWLAGSVDPTLVGVDPAVATPGQQDAMARELWNRNGWSPWPLCGAAVANA